MLVTVRSGETPERERAQEGFANKNYSHYPPGGLVQGQGPLTTRNARRHFDESDPDGACCWTDRIADPDAGANA